MRTRSTLAALAAVAVLAAPVFAAGPFAQVDAGPTSIDFRPAVSGVALTLTVSGPEGFYFQEIFAAGEIASFSVFDAAGDVLPSGSYTWELRAAPEMGDAERDRMTVLRESGADASALRKAGKLPAELEPLSGAFRVEQGSIVLGGATEEAGTPAGGNRLATKDQVIADDLIVDGSVCIGMDCVNGENFGFDTLRLKENNTRIKFDDTSNSGSFPNNDWQLTANDSANGGQNKFSIDDITGGRTPFTIEANAPTNSLYVDDAGNWGQGTSSPAVQVHVVDGNTPALRLEQDGSAGFTAQTWDVAGNEANFFVRDITNGSRLSFRIEPGAAESSIHIDSDSDVGMGTSNPTASLHVKRTGASILVEDGNSTEGARELMQLSNHGTTTQRFTDTQGTADTSDDWAWISGVRTNNRYIITLLGTIASPLWEMTSSGDVTATSFTGTSSREVKEGFVPVEPKRVLEKVVRLPLSEWSYQADESGQRHLGPMAEDFRDAFGLGPDGRHINMSDLGGVSLAAVQGLHQVVEEKDQQIEALRTEVEELKKVVRELAERRGSPLTAGSD